MPYPVLRILWTVCCLAALALAFFASRAHAESMVASYYGAESGKRTASGETFRPSGMTAAHRSLAFGTRLRVCRGERCVVVRITDRGPFIRGRQLDLSEGAARVIGLPGVGRVEVERL
jgi:rare lipoprotein A